MKVPDIFFSSFANILKYFPGYSIYLDLSQSRPHMKSATEYRGWSFRFLPGVKGTINETDIKSNLK